MYTDVSVFWNALGSFWGAFEDKEYVQTLWQSYFNVMSGLYDKSLALSRSVGFTNMNSVIEDKHHSFDVIYQINTSTYSGMLNTIQVSGTEGYRTEYYVNPGTISIPTLTYYYYSSTGVLSSLQTLTEGTDYYLVDMERIRFVGSPPFQPNYTQTHFNGNLLFADTIKRVNPALWGIEPLRVGLTNLAYRDNIYNAFVSGYAYSGIARDLIDAEHFKYLIWGLRTGIQKSPTVSNIKNLYGLARGLPFAHNSGIFASGLIDHIDKTYPINGYYTLDFTGKEYLKSTKPVFHSNDITYDFVATFSGVPTTGQQYLFGYKAIFKPVASEYTQFMGIYVDVASNNLIMQVKGTKEYNTNNSGVVLRMDLDDFDITAWHKYSIKKTGTKDFALGIDDVYLTSGSLATYTWTFPSSGFATIIGVHALNSYNIITLSGETYFKGNIAQFKIRDDSNNIQLYTQIVPTESLAQATVEDLSASGYTISISGSPLWSQVDMPLIGYTTKDYGDTIDRFEVLLPGIYVYDSVNRPSLISGFIDFDYEQYYHISIRESGLTYRGTLSYDTEYVTDLMDSYIPANQRYGINEETYSGIFIAQWGSDSNDGTRRSPVRTFSKAASLINGPNTIWYRQGTYAETISLNTLSGIGTSWSNPVTIKPFPGEYVKLVSNSGLTTGLVQFNKIGSGYISLENFDLDGQNYSQLLVNMAVSGAKYGKLSGCTLYGTSADAMINLAETGHRITRNTIRPSSFSNKTGIKAYKDNNGIFPYSGIISYNEISNLYHGILVSGDASSIWKLDIHHNYLYENTIGAILGGQNSLYFHNNLVEDCGWGIAPGYLTKSIKAYVINNTIKNCKSTSTNWNSALGIAAGIRVGNLTFSSDFCNSGYFLNNALSDCDYAYYDPSGIVDSSNFGCVHYNNISDDNTLPSSGYTFASRNMNSGVIFYYDFVEAETKKDFRLHPYFSSGYSYGTNLAVLISGLNLEDLNIDYSGVTRIGYSGWDAGAFENLD